MNAISRNINEAPCYDSFAGINMYATVDVHGRGPRMLGTIQTISCNITRETVPVYCAGDPNPKTFNKGKRACAGTLVFSQFDRDALMRDVFYEDYRKPINQLQSVSRAQSYLGRFTTSPPNAGYPVNNFANTAFSTLPNALQTGIDAAASADAEEIWRQLRSQRTQFADQLPPFDITVVFVNETGAASVGVIYGVVIVNQSFAWDVNDLMSEQAYTYVCRGIMPLTRLNPANPAMSQRSET